MPVTNPYADASHVQSLLNELGGPAFTLDGTSVPTITEAEGWLDQVAAEVNSVLKGIGYGTVPATGSNDILLIRRFLAQKVAAIVYQAGFMIDEYPAKVKTWETEYAEFLKRLMDNKQKLIDQSGRNSRGSVMVYRYVDD